MGRLAGRHILITGAASGIGLATARLFASEGASLALIDHAADRVAAVARELRASHHALDLRHEDAIVAGVAAAAKEMGGIDGVVNVAGIGGERLRLEDATTADWRNVLDVNLTAPFVVMRESLRHLRRSGTGTVVNVASGQGLTPSAPGMGAYCASKAGLIMLSKTLALELAPDIRVNSVCPGVVDTPILPAGMLDLAAAPSSPYALKRAADPTEIAQAILFLSSFESSFVTGVALAVDGGRTYN